MTYPADPAYYPPPPYPGPPPAPPKKKPPVVLFVVLGAVLLVCCCGGVGAGAVYFWTRSESRASSGGASGPFACLTGGTWRESRRTETVEVNEHGRLVLQMRSPRTLRFTGNGSRGRGVVEYPPAVYFAPVSGGEWTLTITGRIEFDVSADGGELVYTNFTGSGEEVFLETGKNPTRRALRVDASARQVLTYRCTESLLETSTETVRATYTKQVDD